MRLEATSAKRADGAWHVLAALVASDGSAAQPLVTTLAQPSALKRDLADAIHAICTIHGRYLFDDAALREGDSATEWFAAASHAFAAERTYLATLTAAAGPLPSTPGQAATDAALAAQRHAFDMLSRSSRKGCAIGAALALIIDWRAIRTILDAAADRFGVSVPPCDLPGIGEINAFTDMIADSAATQRAIAFGAQQVFAQHRGLWSLLDARASARNHG